MRVARKMLCLAVIGLGVMVPSVWAAPTLSGENLTGMPTVSCAAGNPFIVDWEVSGQATGPYPGTFTETGRFRTEPQNSVPVEFTIQSGATTITGTKRLIGSLGAFCDTSTGKAAVSASLGYTAEWTVTTGDAVLARRGTYSDSGESKLAVSSTRNPPHFSESFTSDQAQATLVKCELVALGTIVIPAPLNACPA